MGSSSVETTLVATAERGVLTLALDRRARRNAIAAESLARAALLQSEDHREGLAAARRYRDPDPHGR